MLTLSLSFNNDGPLGSFFRYICDNGTYKAFYDDLSDGKDNKIDVSKVDVSMDGIELEDREFIAAIKEKREPNASLRAAAALHARARQAREDHRSAAQGARVVGDACPGPPEGRSRDLVLTTELWVPALAARSAGTRDLLGRGPSPSA